MEGVTKEREQVGIWDKQ